MKSGKIVFLSVVVASFMLFAFGVSGASDMGNAVKQACSSCHSTKRICLNAGVKSAEAWKATVEKMVAKGAGLPADQIDAAADYLTALAPGTGPVCE